LLHSRGLGSSQARGDEAEVVRTNSIKHIFLVLSILFVTIACKEKEKPFPLPKPGSAAIDFTCQDLKGQTWSLDKIKGKIVLLRFWTDWCPYCRYEMPVIENYYRKFNRDGFVVLAVNVKQSPQVAEAFAAQLDVTFPILIDGDGKVAQSYGIYSIPTNFLIDRQGIIREICVGELFKNKNFIQEVLRYCSKK
jgi:peroxiredoxin